MADYRVVCITKGDRLNPHTAISRLGVQVASETRVVGQQQAVADLEAGKYQLHTIGNGVRAQVVVATHNGHKYAKTEADGVWPNNLLALPECKA